MMDTYVLKNQKKLRYGITTGTCAAACAKAAAKKLLLGIDSDMITLVTPKQINVNLPVVLEDAQPSDGKVTYRVQKDSGDDPDVTDGVWIYATIETVSEIAFALAKEKHCFFDEQYPNLCLDGGEGVGRITTDGMEQRIGQAAINKIPRGMIFQAVSEVCVLAEYEKPIKITISIPEGVALASKTMNGALGIAGGISVLGTSGILEPMSERAIVDTIALEIRTRYNRGSRSLLITPGNYGQKYVENLLALDISRSVKCSNYIGETLDLLVSYGYEKVLLVGNLGKLVKLAAGIMNTHSSVADGRMEILALHTVLSGGTSMMAEQIMQCVNTEQVLAYLMKWNLKDAVIRRVCDQIDKYVKRRVREKMTVGVVLFSEHYGYLGETTGSHELLELFRKGE